MQKTRVIAGTYNGAYTNENGVKVPYSAKVAGFWKGNCFYCAVIDTQGYDISTMVMTRIEFMESVTEVTEI